ncbi:AsmA-like C-terminal region-containing protein [Sungkyunkwania multivorans]|uniref:AsmA-like C-terminal region-containing protein n=1 Tax=Sungkyunkwania multivorans TaxID=1173618 RepID=A0ABW3D145_9FLAO
MKKALKIIGIFILVCLIGLFALVSIFEDDIVALAKNTANRQLDAELAYSDADLSLFRSFPKTSLQIENLSLVNKKAVFDGDTVIFAKKLELIMPLSALFSSGQIAINKVAISEATVHITIDSLGNANYDIAKENTSENDDSAEPSSGFTFSLEGYSIENSTVIYQDEASKTDLLLENVNHTGKGDLSAIEGSLDTHTDALVSFEFDEVNYLDKNSVKLDAIIGLDLTNNKYTFLENEALVNQLPLVFNGFVQVNENDQEVDISFKTPSSDFKNFLAVIPAEYSKNLNGVQTSGDFTVDGSIKGKIDETYIPKLDINVASKNASFKYPDLPKSVQNININAQLKNETGISEDTYLNIEQLDFSIDQDRFTSSGKVSKLMENPTVDANLNGKINLANFCKAYPAASEKDLKGIITTNLSTHFDMDAIERERYERIKTTGEAEVNDFVYSSKDIVNPITISKAQITFNPQKVTLNKFDALSGKSDIKATGTLNNLFGFLFSDKDLRGNFDVSSNTFAVSDFMQQGDDAFSETEENGGKSKKTESLKIPGFLDCTINANANTVLYDNLTLKDVKGTLRLKDQKAMLSNVTSNLFDGQLALSGEVNTQKDTPSFNMSLDVNSFDIAQSFNGMELFQTLSPIAKAMQGKLNTTLKLSGNLDDSFGPVLNSISGDAFAEVLTSNINAANAPTLQALNSKLNFIDFSKLDLKGLKTTLSFADGKVNVKPFDLKYKDIAIKVGGSHGFDKSMDYRATFKVPAKYLGKEAANLIAQLNEEEKEQISVPLTANIGGSFGDPIITTDLTSAVTDLTNQIIEYKKQKAIDKGKDKLTDVLGNLLGGNDKTKDSITTKEEDKKDPVKDAAGNLLNNLFKKKKKKTDSVPKN